MGNKNIENVFKLTYKYDIAYLRIPEKYNFTVIDERGRDSHDTINFN